jgi:hypothetical protein
LKFNKIFVKPVLKYGIETWIWDVSEMRSWARLIAEYIRVGKKNSDMYEKVEGCKTESEETR